ncbi:cyclohexanone monooxygenase domain protein [Mycobacterium xenopi 4042]|uniref:Cyclohexanone monooxygenase domain protein n=1 Tax=Mycobacterium xenopi 4042 TaxID=1299334 RepID=X8DMQ7_MYCXE|nr:cyclohexanone monooxygenase domain protein [Mycobacterium xenopi 3993]EUA69003.1 cyclohexanone monooxygenase domain protein [Mycobacterium xenopi 4042]
MIHQREVDRARLVAAARGGNMPTLIMVLYQLTGDDRWLQPPYAPTRNRGLGPHDAGACLKRCEMRSPRPWPMR